MLFSLYMLCSMLHNLYPFGQTNKGSMFYSLTCPLMSAPYQALLVLSPKHL